MSEQDREHGMNILAGEIADLRDENRALKTSLAAAEAALREYGDHNMECAVVLAGSEGGEICTCGWAGYKAAPPSGWA